MSGWKPPKRVHVPEAQYIVTSIEDAQREVSAQMRRIADEFPQYVIGMTELARSAGLYRCQACGIVMDNSYLAWNTLAAPPLVYGDGNGWWCEPCFDRLGREQAMRTTARAFAEHVGEALERVFGYVCGP